MWEAAVQEARLFTENQAPSLRKFSVEVLDIAINMAWEAAGRAQQRQSIATYCSDDGSDLGSDACPRLSYGIRKLDFDVC